MLCPPARSRLLLGAAGLALVLAGARPAEAAFTVTFTETGGNVVATGSGAFNTAGASGSPYIVYPSNRFYVNAGAGELRAEPGGYYLWGFTNFTGPASFGTGGLATASQVTGDAFALVAGSEHFLAVPLGYSSGAPLAATLTWNSASFTSLGLTPGTYSWNWGSGSNADSFIIQIGNSTSVPEPASFALLGAGLLGLGALRRARG